MLNLDQFRLEDSPLGPALVARDTPDGTGVVFTGTGWEGRLGEFAARELTLWLRNRFGVDAPLTTCHQVHGTEIREAVAGSGPWQELEACDAIWTSAPGSLAIKVADCVALLMLDEQSGVAVGLHAGWRGASAGIVPRTLAQLSERSDFQPERARAWIGPAIRACCFEVGEDVVNSFSQRRADAESFVDRSSERPHFDVVGVVTTELVEAAVPAHAIIDAGACTRCDDRFHSYRRTGPGCGRNLGILTSLPMNVESP